MRMLSLIPVMLSLAMIAGPVAAQLDAPGSRKTLIGLPGFFVAVEDLDSAATRVGITSAVIQKDVEARLQAAGIRLYTAEDFKNILEVPQLYVNINELALHGAQAGLFTYNATTEVRQAIKLSRNPDIASTSVTWRAPATVGTVGSDNLYVAVRDVIREQVDLLIVAFRSANSGR
jgi:hypothetical protein